jgi:hypothetical protein
MPHRVGWLLAHLRAPRLDRQLAAGSVPWRSPVHAARALQLTSDGHRRGLARSLERLVEHAEPPPGGPFRGSVVQPCREQVREALPLILMIAARLRSGAPVDARGVARLCALLSDGAGPCYSRSDPGALTGALETISQWLDVQD